MNTMNEKLTKKVLVIDDEPMIIDELVEFLNNNGYSHTICQNADDALVAAQTDAFDLIISDINLGTANGLELCQQIHELEAANETPVIFLSGAQIPDIIRRSHSAGGAYYVRKPFDPEVMIELIDKAMWLPSLAANRIRFHENVSREPVFC
ncbi:MAG: response regulator [Planctomycetaceae bacterium]|nr:response regulator [Planctomycetaceae bacterium]